jgi:dihydroorotase
VRALLLLALALPLGGQEICDLLLKNGHVIDPANHRDGRFDVAVIDGKIARVGQDLPASHARIVVDAGQYYVTPGLVDLNTDFDWVSSELGLKPEAETIESGVTTAVDAGSASWKTFEQFKKVVIDHSRTRLLAFLNVGNETDVEAVAALAKKYPQVIVGIRTNGAADLAVKAAELSRTIVMADSDSDRLRPGDIRTHVYGRPTPKLEALLAARKRGVLYDVGHGSNGFWFRIAVPMIQQGFLPDSISSGIDRNSVMLSRATMIDTMSKLLNAGMTLEQVIERSTVNPARAIHRPDLGTLGEGSIADIAMIEQQTGKFGFLDSGHGKLIGDKKLFCVLTVRNGQVVWDTEGLSLPDATRAGPYTNFK